MKERILSWVPPPILYQLSHWKNKVYFDQLRNSKDKHSLSGYDELKCIFVHVPKTAGLAVSRALFGNLGGSHKTVIEYKRIFGLYDFYSYYSFSFVRNPFTRLVSAYTFLKNGGINKKDRKWARENIASYKSFESFVLNWLNAENIWSYIHLLPQHHFLCENDEPQVNFIGRFENLQQDFQKICKELNVDPILTQYNKTKRSQKCEEYYTPEIWEKVVKLYKKDFDIFGYDSNKIEG
ncbi:sulfotransferase family protein [Aliifodinibius sp. S!AR15-10]|uniref:sulfotransferase family protein n=1 Tax=Aliifodinibius sp. S!AR15-10 TaxID=2950437 RepID=UPI0028577B62|nr:sulfotransferase family protein [Aliifodinibius sp. S!AR15-10]MDR8393929.1 sulfotransferase family protein [Aliifodinibius sp. S!AR15-10]